MIRMATTLTNSTSNSYKMRVPPGRLIASTNWSNTQLVSAISNDIDVNFCDELGVYDFLASDEVAVIFLTEADLISEAFACKRKLAKFCKVDASLRKVVIAQRTMLTSEMYVEFQRFCGIDLGLTIIPVNTNEEAAKLLKQMVTCEIKKQFNPFGERPNEVSSPDEALLYSLQSVPGFGDKKTLLALEKFSTLENIVNAPEDELAKIVGTAAANSATNFFHNRF